MLSFVLALACRHFPGRMLHVYLRDDVTKHQQSLLSSKLIHSVLKLYKVLPWAPSNPRAKGEVRCSKKEMHTYGFIMQLRCAHMQIRTHELKETLLTCETSCCFSQSLTFPEATDKAI